MNSVENYAIRYLEPKDVKDLDQYNALLRYTFQVTEDELTATGWKDEEIKLYRAAQQTGVACDDA